MIGALRCGVILVFLAASNLRGQNNTTTAGRQQDLNYVSTTLPQLAANFFAQLDRGTYSQAVAALQARISSATDAELYTGLTQLVALPGDMHTFLGGSAAFAYGDLPLGLVWLEDGLFVALAVSNYAQTIGTQIVAVNGVPIDQVTQLLGTTFAYANDQHLHANVAGFLPSLFLLQGLHIIPLSATSVPITFQTLGGAQFTVTVGLSGAARESGIPGPAPDYLLKPSIYYWFTYMPGNRMIYAKYTVCEDDPNGISVATYSDHILQSLDSNPVDTVVIDFRANGGGDEYLLYPLGVGLFQRLPKLRSNPNFRIYLVIDKGTFSAGKETPMAFKSGYLAMYEDIPVPDLNGVLYVIGEPTGGKPIEFTEAVTFNLPYSDAHGIYSTELVNQTEGVIPDLPNFYPDVSVPTRSTDYFAGHDPVMAAVLARYPGAPPAPSGAVTTVNAASFHTEQGLAPGSLAAAFGTFRSVPDQVLVNGVAGIVVSSALSQVNFLIPGSATTGTATVSVLAAGQDLANGQATITSAGPGLFVLNPADPAQPGAVENQDGTVNSQSNPAPEGSIVAVFGTGYSENAAAQIYFGDLAAQVVYSGPVLGVAGLWQMNVRVPSVPEGVSSLFVTAGNLASNAVTVWVVP